MSQTFALLLAPTLDADALLGALNSRYAVKLFDADRKIDDATWQTLEEALVLERVMNFSR